MIHTPEEMPAAFAKAFNARDLEALLRLNSPQTSLYPDGKTEMRGPQVAEALKGFLGLQGAMQMKVKRVSVNGDTALVVADWVIDGPQGLQGTTSDVLRRGRDGGWTYLIDAPFGLLA
jgi:ketosteroid isomerase-like protein